MPLTPPSFSSAVGLDEGLGFDGKNLKTGAVGAYAVTAPAAPL